MRTAAENFTGARSGSLGKCHILGFTDRCPIIGGGALAEINSNERHEKASFWVGDRSFLICDTSFGGGKLPWRQQAKVRWEGILEEAPGHRCIYTYFQS
jgi:hypothetical protein